MIRSQKLLSNTWTRSGNHTGTFSLESLLVATQCTRETVSCILVSNKVKSLSLSIKLPEQEAEQHSRKGEKKFIIESIKQLLIKLAL